MASAAIEIRDSPVTALRHHLQEREDQEQLPPLLPSLAIEGLPPLQHCLYLADAEKVVSMDYIKRWQIPSMESYFVLGVSLTGIMHWGVTSVDRLVATAVLYGILFMMDDLFFDSPNDVLLGHLGAVRGSPEEIKGYLDKVLNGYFAQKSHLATTPIEVIFSEIGRDLLRLSNPEWFSTLVAAIDEWFLASIGSHADIVSGESLCVQDLEAYSLMRAGNFGGSFIQLMQEFAADVYLPEEMRSLPFMVQARTDATVQMAFVNDIYSYHKESMVEANPRNVVTVLMESQGKTFVQSVHATIELANMHAVNILDLEMKTSDAIVQRHLQSLKDVMAGQLYYSAENLRYRHPDSVFPELRDIRASSSQNTTNLASNPQAGVAQLPTGLTLRAGH